MSRHPSSPSRQSRAMDCARVVVLMLAAFLPAGLLLADVTAPAPGSPALSSSQVEIIVCIRHGEKPKSGIGNLDVQGLNRALALPEVLARYGTPFSIFAPDPAADEVDEGAMTTDGTAKEPVCYVRPLLTIGPTAIRCGLPINTTFGFRHIAGLEAELDKPLYRGALVFVAWEHHEAEQFMRNEVRDHGGNPNAVPVWAGKDFDSIYVARISRNSSGAASVDFRVDHEGLDGLSGDFPKPAGKAPK
jgi:hypothetical protein